MRQGGTLKELRNRDNNTAQRRTVLDEDFWERFVLMSKVCLLRDREATIYDVFDTLRTRTMGGVEFSEKLMKKLDAEIEAEERVNPTRII